MNLLQGEKLQHTRLADYSAWRAGGIAHCIYKPANLPDLQHFLRQLPPQEPLLWLGLGSNTLIRDGGFKGTVIVTQNGLRDIAITEHGAKHGAAYASGNNTVHVAAGVSCASMARHCARANLRDAEFLAGIPGTIGGALRMNAGCSNGTTWEHVIAVTTIDRMGNLHHRPANDFTVAYRKVTGLATDEWFVSGTFKLATGDKAHSLELIRQLLEHRTATQPTNEANCGSVFRNPPEGHAARLIENCGLKGYRIGGAVVSQKHANFIINDGNASSKDIEMLIEHVTATVLQHAGVTLQREVHIWGEQQPHE